MRPGLAARLECMEADGGEGIVLRLPSDGDAAAAALLAAQRLLAEGRSVVVSLDLSRPADVATVGALAGLLLSARRGHGRLTVAAPDAALRELADLMGLRVPLHDVLGDGTGDGNRDGSTPGAGTGDGTHDSTDDGGAN
jgi:ABC-type transporter Mla MlaB component